MAFKERIQANNAELEEIEEIVESLPSLEEIIAGEETFIPENIREGVDILGIIGSMPEGVTGIDYGTVTVSSSQTINISHGLGVKPRMVIIQGFTNSSSQAGVATAVTSSESYLYYGDKKTGGCYSNGAQIYALNGYGPISSLSDTSASYNTNNSSYAFRGTYYWIAIA